MIHLLNSLFNDAKNYDFVNKQNKKVKIRRKNNGIQLNHCYLYKFLYSNNENTKDRTVSIINQRNGKNFTRQSFESKENNISIKVYSNILDKIRNYYNAKKKDDSNLFVISIDGTYNNDCKMKEQLNMGFFDVSNGAPIDLKLYGRKNKNNEVKCAIDYITKNINAFKNAIIVVDRAYYTFKFIRFLLDNNIYFVIRCKWDAKNLDSTNELKKNIPDYENILYIRKKISVYKFDNILEKNIDASTSKKKYNKYKINIKNDCTIVTNLTDEKIYSKEKILEIYKSRWDIETFFKYIKVNFKFQHIKEKNKINFQKMYIIEQIIMYLIKLIEEFITNKKANKKLNNYSYKINYSNLIKGIFDYLIWEIINGKLNKHKLDVFCKNYIKIIQNKKDRSFPRISKTPFTKWYIKSYSNLTKYFKIIKAISDDDTDSLNKNLKIIANRIISIKKYKSKK